jgi:chromosome segregation ATPase
LDTTTLISLALSIGGMIFAAGIAWATIRLTIRRLCADVKKTSDELSYSDQQIEELSRSASVLKEDCVNKMKIFHAALNADRSSNSNAHNRITDLLKVLNGLQADLRVLSEGMEHKLRELSKAEELVGSLMVQYAEIKTMLNRAVRDIGELQSQQNVTQTNLARLEGRVKED